MPSPFPLADQDARRQLRLLIRRRRRELDPCEAQRRSEDLCRRIANSELFRRADTLAAYLPNDGEVDLRPLLARATRAGKRNHLPVLSPVFHNRLWFAPFDATTPLAVNRFGIPEPDLNYGSMHPAWALDVILLPLVAFDPVGNRLGMGGGFYDRTLAYLERRGHWRKPRLIGVAFELQKVERLPCAPWDVPLDGVVTEAAWYAAEG
jgi:5-formyltetrahydrofolate cyclo-ligase